MAPCSAAEAERVGRLAERRGDYVRLFKGPDSPEERPRKGTPHRLGVSKEDFVDVFSVKAKHKAHSGILEAEALLLFVRWALRSSTARDSP